jgi:transcription elongation factor
MNNHLRDLLTKTSGIIHNVRDIRSIKIDPTEYQNLLRMKSTKTDIVVGNWVRVNRGIYKGDVGQIAATHAWGVDLYLVPRIPTEKNGNTLKRKASRVIPEPTLFCAQTASIRYRPDETYRIGRLIFEHGLLVKSFDYHSISPQVCEIPWKLYSLFSSSKHPKITVSSLPRPQEWIFATGDNVIVYPSNNKGIISSINTTFAEVEISEEGIHCVPWQNIKKYFKIGDYVCVSSGLHLNTNGWVIDVNENTATIANKTTEGEINNFDNSINVRYCEFVLNNILIIFTDHRSSFKPSYCYFNTFSTRRRDPIEFSRIPASKTTQTSLVRNPRRYF